MNDTRHQDKQSAHTHRDLPEVVRLICDGEDALERARVIHEVNEQALRRLLGEAAEAAES